MRSMLLLGVASAISAAAPGRVNAMQFDFTPSNPQYFSGTNCNPSCRVSITTETAISRVQMIINGTVVYDTNNLNPLPSPSQFMGAGTTFDSSHFGDGSTITVTVNAWDNSPTPVEQTKYISAPAYNKAYVLGNWTFPDGAAVSGTVNSDCGAMNESTTYATQDAKLTILPALPQFSVFYIYTHANIGLFVDCLGTSTAPETYQLFANSDPTGAPTIATEIGSKATSQAPYSYVFIDGCNGGGDPTGPDTQLSVAFGIDPSSPQCIDQGWQGFRSEVLDDTQHVNFTERIWSDLQAGETAYKAEQDALSVSPPDEYNVGDGAALPVFFGDSATTVHATYYGGPTGSWFSPGS